MISSMDYYSLNKLFLSVEYKLYEIIAENFDCTIYCASTFWSGPDEHVDDCPSFFEMINEEYNTNFEPNSIISYYDVEEEIIRQDFIKYIELRYDNPSSRKNALVSIYNFFQYLEDKNIIIYFHYNGYVK